LGGPTTSISAARLEEFNYQMFDSFIYDEDISINQDGTFDVKIQNTTVHANYIINATGHGRHNSPILDDLKKHGLAEINPNLGILKTRSNSYTIEPSGIACIGPSTHFGTDGIESFAQYLERYVKDLVI
ncbi:hypothetical protein KC909_04055, partial [Candidatus Dojkabacteria bacterium]|nr:hypothetical protein [Candidatus Dojkabacteria bacterium]